MTTSERIQEVRMNLMRAKRGADWDTVEMLKIAEDALAFAENLARRAEEKNA